MKLWEINNEIESILNTAEVDEETGELLIDIKKLDALNMVRDDKFENIIKYYLDANLTLDKFTAQIGILQNRRRILSNKVNSLKTFLESHHTGSKKAYYGVHEIGWLSSKKVNDGPMESLGEDYKTTTENPNKALIKKAIEAGIDLKGWNLIETNNIQIK